MMSGIEYSETQEFGKDFKKLLKRFQSLSEDLEIAKRAVIELYHVRGIDNASVFEIPGYGAAGIKVYKIKKFACKALKGTGNRSGIRVIYAYYEGEARVEFIEIYYKGDKEKEDGERIREYLRGWLG
jgi:hypothetical protein